MLRDNEILLRPISIDDTDFILELRNNVEFSNNYFTDPPIYDFEHINWLKNKINNNKELDFIIEVKGEKAGRVRISNINYRHQKCEFNIELHKNFIGRGIAKRASILLINYVFESLPIRKIYLYVFEDNTSAINLYKRLNFEVEGIFKDEVLKNNKWKSVFRMALFRNVWKNKNNFG